MLIAGCSGNDTLTDGNLSGEERLPLRLEATLSDGTGMTRAAGKEFAAGDVLKAYLRHVTISGTDPDYTYTLLDGEYSWKQRMVDFTVKSGFSMTDYDANTKQTSDLDVEGGLYWDDFSQGAKGDATDIRTYNHGLQSYYGYCYNGGTPSTALTEDTGVLGWTVPASYANATAFKQADLLWSVEQPAVTYAHAASQGAEHGTLTIPYTHAMSEVTVEVTCDASFTKSAPLLNSYSSLTLYGMNTKVELNAPSKSKTYTASTTPADTKPITMFGDPAYSSGATRTYTALVVPGSKMKVGEKLLDITIDGVKYEVNITSTMLTNAEGKWGRELDVDGDYYLTKPGVNYKLSVNVGKAQVHVIATIAGWTDVTAEGDGHVHYDNDVTTTVTGDTFTDESKFNLYRLLSTATNEADASKRDNSSYGSVATVPQYSTASGKWSNTQPIYWTSTTDKYFYRALAKKTAEDANTITNEGVTTSVAQGSNDILWGTTPEADGYAKGAALSPRSSEVPISFEHALSRVTFKLATGTGDAEVTLTGATIAVSNLYTTGTITIDNGSIAELGDKTGIAATTAPITKLYTIPQTIGDDAIITITLSDGTTKYTLKLNECVVTGGSTPVTEWEAGKDYVYTITVEKDKVQFRALVKDWVVVEGSGNANLEWD